MCSQTPCWLYGGTEGMLFPYASVLFYIEVWTRLHGKLAYTQVKCTWLLPAYVKEISYACAEDINFKSARKLNEDLDALIENIVSKILALVHQKLQLLLSLSQEL